MSNCRIEFGFLTNGLEFSRGKIAITPLADARNSITEIKSSSFVHNNWFYAPSYPSRVFSLPHTHELRHADVENREHLEFLIWCLGFFLGIRLSTFEAGYMDATPIESGCLTDFILLGSAAEADSMELAEQFWTQNLSSPANTKRMTGIIHCLFLAQNPNHLEFESF